MDTGERQKRELKTEEVDTSASKKIKLEPMGEGDATLLADSVTEPSSPPPSNAESFDLKDEVKDEDKEPEFFTTSMYTDEFTNMLDTVLNGEQFLFDTDELQVFEQFQLLEGSSTAEAHHHHR
ncbi:hypothetical protein MAM1_0007c00824 [Mucor ambiguus]|uniref:Uncharacterized protein n=1 Tax=Mucor ambiguus TaxID=91626 RepID=A0A0C9M0A0_9FUNG|nr:hypothetical protein MAM1_0007c00824 [Mucor ambiguus]